MAETKTKVTKIAPKAYIDSLDSESRRADARALLKIFETATGWKPQMWGPSIIGFGRYAYTYDSGHSGEMCVVGFSPRKAAISIYSGVYPSEAPELVARLGKVKASKGCIYVNKLADINAGALERLLKAGVASVSKKWPVTAK